MKFNNFIFFSIIIFSIVLFSGVGSAVECNATIGSDNCTLSGGTLTLNNGNYLYNGTITGVININGSNAVLDCAGASLIGNSTSLLVGIFSTQKTNITIRNCNLVNYYLGIEFFLSNTNSKIINTTIINSSDRGIHIRQSTSVEIINTTIINPTNTGIDIDNAADNNLTGNNVSGALGGYAYWFRNSLSSRNNLKDSYSYNNIYSIYFSSSGENNTVNNHKASNDTIGLYFTSSNKTTIINSTFNLTQIAYGIRTTDRIDNITIINTNFYGRPITGSNDGYAIFDTFGVTNLTIKDTLFRDFGQTRIYNGKFITFINVSTVRQSFFIDLQNITNFNSIGSLYQDMDKVGFENSYNINFVNDTIINLTNNKDGWLLGIALNNVTGFSVNNVNFTDVGQIGLMIRQSRNGIIQNNNINCIDLNTIIINQVNEPGCMGIAILENYKKYTNNIGAVFSNYTELSTHYSNNISISNTTFGSNVQVLLRTQGTTNLNHDISNYRFFSWQLPYFLDRDDNYVSNNFNNISNINQTLVRSIYMRQGSFIFNTREILYAHTNSYDYFLNENTTIPFQINIYNKSSSLIYFSNNSVACSNINSCNGNINITLFPTNNWQSSYNSLTNGANLTLDGRFDPINSSWIVNATAISGRQGTGYMFENGSNEIINTTQDTGLQIESGNFSVSVWLYSTNNSMNALPRIWEKGSMYMAMMGDPTNGKWQKLAIEFQNSTSAGTVEYWSQTDIPINTWIHIVAIWNNDTRNVTWYYNTVAENSSQIDVLGGITVQKSTSGNPFLIGNRRTLGRAWNGTIDELLVYNRTLTQAEINVLYNDGAYRNGGNYAYVLDNYNLTEGVTRANNPISITSNGRETTKTVTSSLTDSVNITLLFDVNDCNINSITYSGGSIAPYSCSSNQVSIVGANIPGGSSQFSIVYNGVPQSTCNSAIDAFTSYPALIGLIGIMFIIGMAFVLLMGYGMIQSKEPITKEQVGVFFLVLIGMGILIIIGIVAIGSICSVGVI